MSDHAQGDVEDPEIFPPGTIVRPRKNDVLASKSRKEQQHPGNVFYWSLIEKAALPPGTRGLGLQKAASRIYDSITKDRKGQFLRKQSGGWTVLDMRGAMIKVKNSLKYIDNKNHGPERVDKRKRPEGDGTASPPRKKAARQTTKQRPTQYVVKAGSKSLILPFAQDLIGAVCSQRDGPTAIRFLSESGVEETPQQRNVRLQLRQRYHAALRQGQGLVDFSRKLLAGWGATLEQGGRKDEEAANGADNGGKAEQSMADSSLQPWTGGGALLATAPMKVSSLDATPKIKNGENRRQIVLPESTGNTAESTEPASVLRDATGSTLGMPVANDGSHDVQNPMGASTVAPAVGPKRDHSFNLDYDFTEASNSNSTRPRPSSDSSPPDLSCVP